MASRSDSGYTENGKLQFGDPEEASGSHRYNQTNGESSLLKSDEIRISVPWNYDYMSGKSWTPTNGHWNSHRESPSRSTSASSSKRKKSKKKRHKTTEHNNLYDSSDSHSLPAPDGASSSGGITFDLMEEDEEEEQARSSKLRNHRDSNISVDNNRNTFLFDEESRMLDVVSPSVSEIHGADFSVDDPSFSYRGVSEADTEVENDNVDISRREIDVESLHTQQIPNVNGNLDSENKFHPWHETYSVQSTSSEPLHILPYTVIDF